MAGGDAQRSLNSHPEQAMARKRLHATVTIQLVQLRTKHPGCGVNGEQRGSGGSAGDAIGNIGGCGNVDG
jgi:hypothetical protein